MIIAASSHPEPETAAWIADFALSDKPSLAPPPAELAIFAAAEAEAVCVPEPASLAATPAVLAAAVAMVQLL